MTFYCNPGEFGAAIAKALADPEVRIAIHEAAASAVHTIVLQNIGDSGVDRPSAWPALSSRYAKRVNRSHATLEVTRELKRAVRSESSVDEGVVWFDESACEYGPLHQWGDGYMPERPFFPISGGENGEVTPYTQNAIQQAAIDALSSTFYNVYDKD